MTELTLRDARPDDRAAIEQCTISAYEEYGAIMPELWVNYRHNILGTLADVRPAEQIVAERDGAILGTVLLFPAGTAFEAPDDAKAAPPAPEIRLLAVTPAARGSGAGKALMLECLRRAQQAGYSSVTLHTTNMMAVAMSMYERMGFVRSPELDFAPTPEFVIKGYRYTFSDPASAVSHGS